MGGTARSRLAPGRTSAPPSKPHSACDSFVQRRPSMRRLFADRLVIATAFVVILMSVLFTYLRVAAG
jgi:hypothetical protein